MDWSHDMEPGSQERGRSYGKGIDLKVSLLVTISARLALLPKVQHSLNTTVRLWQVLAYQGTTWNLESMQKARGIYCSSALGLCQT